MGLAIVKYEWQAVIVLVIVAKLLANFPEKDLYDAAIP